MKKRKLAVLTAACLMGAVVAGCAENGDNKEQENTADASGEATSEDVTAEEVEENEEGAEAGEAGEAAAEPVTVFGEDAYISYYNLDEYVKLGEYEGVEIKVEPVDVTDEEVDNEITANYLSRITEEVEGKAVENGDIANIDYEGKYADSGEAFEGGTAQGYDLTIGSGSFIAGFEEGLIGAEVGQTLDLNLTFPEDYHSEDLAGKDVVFTVTVNSIKAPAKEVTDDNVGSLAIEGVETVADLKAYVKNDLTATEQNKYDNQVSNDAMQAAVDNAEFLQDFPQPLVDRYVQMYENSLNYNAQMMSYYTGQTMTGDEYLEQYLSIQGEDTQDLDSYKNKVAVDQLKSTFTAYAIAAEQNFEVAAEDIDNEINTALASSGYSSIEEYVQNYTDTVGMDVRQLVEESIIDEKAIQYVSQLAVVSAP
ncbi:trigger factor [Butyrivibrio sp. MC2013]|uniref:trigger factor n=1 Tax=Butyrivibrio sp. MC2013 TaxID=1280686 RepID=UPI000421DD2B|nr:trigger factor [Butyrivibrio sp. MC2013]